MIAEDFIKMMNSSRFFILTLFTLLIFGLQMYFFTYRVFIVFGIGFISMLYTFICIMVYFHVSFHTIIFFILCLVIFGLTLLYEIIDWASSTCAVIDDTNRKLHEPSDNTKNMIVLVEFILTVMLIQFMDHHGYGGERWFIGIVFIILLLLINVKYMGFQMSKALE